MIDSNLFPSFLPVFSGSFVNGVDQGSSSAFSSSVRGFGDAALAGGTEAISDGSSSLKV